VEKSFIEQRFDHYDTVISVMIDEMKEDLKTEGLHPDDRGALETAIVNLGEIQVVFL
jgi:hypothetical protein